MVCWNGMMLVCYGMLYYLVGFHEIFIGYEMEVETHVHVHIQNQLGFHELQLHAITWVEYAPPHPPHVFMAQCV